MRCRRCHQQFVPGQPAPWCLGARYECDTSTAEAVPVAASADVPAPAPARHAAGHASTDSADVPRAGSGHDPRTVDELAAVMRALGDQAPTTRAGVMRLLRVGTGRADKLLARTPTQQAAA